MGNECPADKKVMITYTSNVPIQQPEVQQKKGPKLSEFFNALK